MIAKVKWYNADRKIGFATAEGVRGEILLREQHFTHGLKCLFRGDKIYFIPIPSNPVKPSSIRDVYGPQATRIRLIVE